MTSELLNSLLPGGSSNLFLAVSLTLGALYGSILLVWYHWKTYKFVRAAIDARLGPRA